VWGRSVNGLTLTFHLAGINNQNFLMRDEETGTYWQQISGRAISGPLAGQALKLVHSDELTFAVWKSEQPNGEVLKDIPNDVPKYAPKNWETKLAHEYPAVLSFPEHGLQSRDIMLGIEVSGEARAYLYSQIAKQQMINDLLGSESVLLAVGPDGQSVRAFSEEIPGLDMPPEFFRTSGGEFTMIDSTTGSGWNFQGCAISGKLKGTCLKPVEVIKDFWFDWRNYHPATTVYSGPGNRIGRSKQPPADR
jgi:hypothetical protein